MKYLYTILMAIILSAICNNLAAQEKSIEVSVDIENVNGKEQRNFTVTIGEGSVENEIAWKDNGEIPADIKAQLEKEGVDINMLEGDDDVKVTLDDSKNKKVETAIEIIKISSDDNEGHHKQDKEVENNEDGDILIIKLKDGEELPDDIKKILDEHDIDIEEIKKEGLRTGHKKGTKILRKKAIKIKTKDEEGNEMIMEWNGDGEAPATIQKLLEEEGIDLDEEGEHKMIFISEGNGAQKVKTSKESRKLYRIKTLDEGGNEKIIEWNGEGEMPSEIKEHKNMFKQKNIKTNRSNRNKAQLGIMIEENENSAGVRVIDVVDGSPASAAGLEDGYSITAINDKKVNSIDELLSVLQPFEPEETINVKFNYEGGNGNVDITLGGVSTENNIFIFKDAIQGEDFDMFKKVEKCDETGNTKTTIKIKTVSEEQIKETKKVETRTIPTERQLELSSFSAFPNPTSDKVFISFMASKKPTVIQVTDITGKEIFKEVVDDFTGYYSKDLDLSSFAKGQYILYVIQDQKIYTESIILQ